MSDAQQIAATFVQVLTARALAGLSSDNGLALRAPTTASVLGSRYLTKGYLANALQAAGISLEAPAYPTEFLPPQAPPRYERVELSYATRESGGAAHDVMIVERERATWANPDGAPVTLRVERHRVVSNKDLSLSRVEAYRLALRYLDGEIPPL